MCLVLLDADPSPARISLPGLGSGVAARDRESRAGEPRAADVGEHRRRHAGACRRHRPRRCVRGGRRDVINRHRLWQLAADAGLIVAAWYLAFRLRFDQPRIPPYYEDPLWRSLPIVVVFQLAIFVLFGFYNRWWRYVSTRDMWTLVRGVSVACLVSSLVVYFVAPVEQIRLPRSIAIMDWLLLLAFVAGSRMLARTILERPSTKGIVARGKEVIVAGAGDAAQVIVKE